MKTEDRILVQKAFMRLKLLRPGEFLPAVLEMMESAIEETRSYFFVLPRTGLVLVKCADVSSMDQLWKQVESARKADPPRHLLPAPRNVRADGLLVYLDGRGVEELFRRLNLPTDEVTLVPRHIYSGLAGFSRLYHLQTTPALGIPPQNFLVKFDRPDRLAKEWASINRFRRQNSIRVPTIQFPYFESMPNDGPIIYELFQSASPAIQVFQLGQFALRNLVKHPARVTGALSLLQQSLDRLYMTAVRDRSRQMIWSELDEERELKGNLLSRVLKQTSLLLPRCGGDQPTFLLDQFEYVQPIMDPLFEIELELSRQTESLIIGATHGDLQATNVLIGVDSTGNAADLALIDLEKFSLERPLLSDLVRIEADFWRSIVGDLVAFPGTSVETDQWLTRQAAIAALDHLDRRQARLVPLDKDVRDLANAIGSAVFALRKYAAKRLHPESREDGYLSPDYFTALKHYYLRAVQKPLVYKRSHVTLLVMLCAALAQQTASGQAYVGPYTKWEPLEGSHGPPTTPESVFGMAIEMAPYLRVRRHILELDNAVELFEKSHGCPVSNDLLEVLCRINVNVYLRSPWGRGGGKAVIREKMQRNGAHLNKHPHSILLLRAFEFGDVLNVATNHIGFSHVMPLNEDGYRRYVSGEIEDNRFPPDAMSAPGETPVALLLFSLGLDKFRMAEIYGSQMEKAEFDAEAKSRLLALLCSHLRLMMRVHRMTVAKILVQNDRSSDLVYGFDRLGFRYSDCVSKDNQQIRSLICKCVSFDEVPRSSGFNVSTKQSIQ